MAISFTCTECDRDIKVKDALAGRKIKCPGCEAALIVPDAGKETAVTAAPNKSARRGDEIKERPRKQAPPPDDEPDEDEDQPRKKDRKKKKKQSNTGLIIALAGGVGVVLLGVVLGVVFLMPAKTEPPPKAPPKV